MVLHFVYLTPLHTVVEAKTPALAMGFQPSENYEINKQTKYNIATFFFSSF